MSPANLSENPPAHVSLLLDFANTIDIDDGTEHLNSPEALAAWLGEHALTPPGARATTADLHAAHTLRTALRDQLRTNHGPGHGEATGGGSGGGAALESAAGRFPLRMAVRDGAPVVVPAGDGVPGALGSVVAAILTAQGDGSLPRLKICAEDTCQYAFADSSKNRSRQWCSMSVCGNRAKTRTYRARRRDTP